MIGRESENEKNNEDIYRLKQTQSNDKPVKSLFDVS